MNNPIDEQKAPRNGKVLAGLILLGVGALLLFRQLHVFFFPYWLFSFPMLLIVIGLYFGAKHNFRNSTWMILVFIGSFFLIDDIFPAIETRNLFWPVALIAFGIWLVLGRNRNKSWKQNLNFKQDPYKDAPFNAEEPVVDYTVPEGEQKKNNYTLSEDYLDAVSIFSGIKKTILSKDFKGGEVVNVFGGAEIDLTQADINGRVIIEATQVFGGLKLFVPPHWQVVSNVDAVFAGVDDKRRFGTAPQNSDKVLVLKGFSIFAGIDIRSF